MPNIPTPSSAGIGPSKDFGSEKQKYKWLYTTLSRMLIFLSKINSFIDGGLAMKMPVISLLEWQRKLVPNRPAL